MCKTTEMKKVHIYISSRDRFNPDSNDTNDFEVKLTPGLRNPKYFSIGNVQFPRTYYNINSYNDEFIFTDSALTQFTVNLTHQDIDIVTFLSDLQTAINALGADQFALSYDSNRGRVTIEQTTNTGATIDWSASSEATELRDMLGFNADLTLANGVPQEAGNVAEFSYTKVIFIESPNIASRLSYFQGNQNTNILFDIPVNNNFGEQLNFEQDYNLTQPCEYLSTVNSIRLRVIDEKGRLVDMNSGEWCFDLTFFYQDDPCC